MHNVVEDVGPEFVDMIAYIAVSEYRKGHFMYRVEREDQSELVYLLLIDETAYINDISPALYPPSNIVVNDVVEAIKDIHGLYPMNYRIALRSIARRISRIGGGENDELLHLKDESNIAFFTFNEDNTLITEISRSPFVDLPPVS